jgi:hypothetical protein
MASLGVTAVPPGRADRRRPAWPLVLGLVAISLAAALGGVATGLGELMGAAVAIAVPIGLAIYAAPQLGPYLWLIGSPLTVGLARGDILPFVRPNEALLLLILGAVAFRVVPLVLAGRWRLPPLGRFDLAFGLLVVTGSLLPICIRLGRDLPLVTDDLLYSLVLIKYLLLYTLFRLTITTTAQVRVCLVLALAAAVPVAFVALLQVNGLFGVPELLARYYDSPFSGGQGAPVTSRGTSTVASSFGVANLMIHTACIVSGWMIVYGRPRGLLLCMGVVCLFGVLAAGQFSGIIGIAIAITITGWLIGRLRQVMTWALPALFLGAALLWPVLEQRLSGFERDSGLPQSWEGRIDNMERFILPELTSGDNWFLGVRPAPRVEAPEWWREYVYIESGYIWLLWIGGVPFLVAFLAFAWVGISDFSRVCRTRLDAVGIAALAATTGLSIVTVLMLFDPHLTMRGGADLLFPLMALALLRPAARRDPEAPAERARP